MKTLRRQNQSTHEVQPNLLAHHGLTKGSTVQGLGKNSNHNWTFGKFNQHGPQPRLGIVTRPQKNRLKMGMNITIHPQVFYYSHKQKTQKTCKVWCKN